MKPTCMPRWSAPPLPRMLGRFHHLTLVAAIVCVVTTSAPTLAGGNDVATTDVATTDAATTDAATPDVATPDVATTEVATTDVATTDVATTDAATPDVATATAVIRLQLIVDDVAVLGSLARFLMDEGLVVSAPRAGMDGITHVVMVGTGDGGLAVVCRGRETTASVVPPGPRALVELELGQRIKALVLSTPPLPALTSTASGTAAAPVLRLDLTDGTGARELGDGLAVAILEAGVALGTVVPAVRLCVVADDDEVGVSRAASVDGVCADAQTLPRDTALAEASRWLLPLLPLLPRRLPAPPPTTAPTTAPTAAPTTAPTLPFSIGVQGGALGRLYGIDPLVVTDLSLWWWSTDVVGVPVVWGPQFVVGGSGSLGAVSIAEPFFGVGGVARTALTSDLSLSVGLVAGAWLHSWLYTDVDAGVAADPLLLLPASVALTLWPGIEGTLGVAVGSATRTRIHTVDGGDLWERQPVFISVSSGLRFNFSPGSGQR